MRPHVISVPYRYDRFEEGLGLGPGRLLEAGVAEQAASLHVASLDDADREDDRIAVNIGMLGRSTATLVAQARATARPLLVLAGDDTATVGVVAGLQESDGPDRPLGIVWLDAHGDFNTPDTSYSGILAGMPLAVIAGLAGPRWRDAAGLSVPLPGDRILLVGARELDKAEDELLQAHQVPVLNVEESRSGPALERALAKLTARCDLIYVNVDLDVLSPHLVPSSTTPSENGFELDELGEILRSILETGLVAAVSVTSLNPLGGARGESAAQSAWRIVEMILAEWKRVPPLPAAPA